MVITTRTAVPLDLAAIVKIYNQAIASHSKGHLEPLTEDGQRQWFADHAADYPILVAALDGPAC